MGDGNLKGRATSALHEVAVAAGRLGDSKSLGQLVVERAQVMVGGDAAVLRWFDPASGSFRLLASAGAAADPALAIDAVMPTAIGDAFKTRRPVVVNDYAASGQSTRWGRRHHVHAQVAVPLLVEGRSVGTLAVLSFGNQAFSESDAVALSLMSAIVAPALEATRLSSEVNRQKEIVAQVYDALGVNIIVYDRDGRPIYYNHAAQAAYANALKDPSGKRDHTYPVFHFDGRPVAPEERPFARAMAAKAPVRGVVAGYDVDGVRRWAVVDAVPVLTADGDVDFVITSSVDITQVKEAESREQAIIAAQQEIASSEVDFDQLLRVLSERAVALMGADAAAVMLPEGDELVVLAPAGDPAVRPGFRLPIDGSLAGLAYRTGAVQVVSDASTDHRVHAATVRARGTGSMISAPLISDDGVIGVLQLISYTAGALDATDVRTLEMFAGFAAAAYQRSESTRRLRESEHRVRAVTESAPDPIVVFNSDGDLVDFNPAAERTFMRRREEVVGRNVLVLLASKHLPAFHRWMTAARDANSHEYAGRSFEATGKRGDGSEFPMEIAITDLPEETRLVAAFIRDLTLRERLKESRSLLSSVVASAPVIVLACSVDGVITLAEGSGLSSLDLAPGEAVGRNLRELARWDANANVLIDRALGGESLQGRLHVTSPDVHMSVVSSPMVSDDFVVTGISLVLTDVTARVVARAAQRESDAKSRLMAMMNHEVRTPLNGILGFARLLQDPQFGALNEKQYRYVSNIESSGNHLLELVNQSLDLARLDVRNVRVDLADVCVQNVIAQAAEQVRPLAESNGLTLSVLPVAELFVVADRRLLVQVLLNLLSNAIRHTRRGGSVTLSAQRAGSDVLISVADTGEGISAQDQSRLFEEFYQASNHAPGGNGLGLAISRRLVQMMGGSIGVESELGRGSLFTVRLRSPHQRTPS